MAESREMIFLEYFRYLQDSRWYFDPVFVTYTFSSCGKAEEPVRTERTIRKIRLSQSPTCIADFSFLVLKIMRQFNLNYAEKTAKPCLEKVDFMTYPVPMRAVDPDLFYARSTTFSIHSSFKYLTGLDMATFKDWNPTVIRTSPSTSAMVQRKVDQARGARLK